MESQINFHLSSADRLSDVDDSPVHQSHLVCVRARSKSKNRSLKHNPEPISPTNDKQKRESRQEKRSRRCKSDPLDGQQLSVSRPLTPAEQRALVTVLQQRQLRENLQLQRTPDNQTGTNQPKSMPSKLASRLKRVFSSQNNRLMSSCDVMNNSINDDNRQSINIPNQSILSQGSMSARTASTTNNERFSFASESTGYSSARSSIRSSTEQPYKPLLSHENSKSTLVKEKILEDGEPTYLQRIAMELVDTERAYVNDLYSIIQCYLNRLLHNREQLGVTAVEVCQLFGNIEQLMDFNRHFYSLLDGSSLQLVTMAECFVKLEHRFDSYAEYCTQYPRMTSTLYKLEQRPQVKEFLAECQLLAEHSLPLGPYLLKPVQRVLKYHLFLENTLRHWDESRTKEVLTLRSALQCMTARAKHINDVKRRGEHSQRVQQLQTALQTWNTDNQCQDLTQYGDLLLESQFRLFGSKTTRQVFLFEEMLLLCKEKSDGALLCKDYIMCSNLMLVENIAHDTQAFQVLCHDNTRVQYTLSARTAEQKRLWVRELKRLVYEHFQTNGLTDTECSTLLLNTQIAPSGGREKKFARRHVPKYLQKRRKSTDSTLDYEKSEERHETSVDRCMKHSNADLSPTQARSASTSNLLHQNTSEHSSKPIHRMARAQSETHTTESDIRYRSFFERRRERQLPAAHPINLSINERMQALTENLQQLDDTNDLQQNTVTRATAFLTVNSRQSDSQTPNSKNHTINRTSTISSEGDSAFSEASTPQQQKEPQTLSMKSNDSDTPQQKDEPDYDLLPNIQHPALNSNSLHIQGSHGPHQNNVDRPRQRTPPDHLYATISSPQRSKSTSRHNSVEKDPNKSSLFGPEDIERTFAKLFDELNEIRLSAYNSNGNLRGTPAPAPLSPSVMGDMHPVNDRLAAYKPPVQVVSSTVSQSVPLSTTNLPREGSGEVWRRRLIDVDDCLCNQDSNNSALNASSYQSSTMSRHEPRYNTTRRSLPLPRPIDNQSNHSMANQHPSILTNRNQYRQSIDEAEESALSQELGVVQHMVKQMQRMEMQVEAQLKHNLV